MELIPILSLIILVAPISTFILAVGAYILYKIRESRGRVAQAPQPAAIPAELIAPAPLVAEQRITQPGIRRTLTGEHYPSREVGSDYQPSYTHYQEGAPQGPEMRPTYVTSNGYSESTYERPPTDSSYESERYSTKKKFMRYTQEGYIEPSGEEKRK